MTHRYILINNELVKYPDLMEWGKWMEVNIRAIAREKVGDMDVSTIFLGLDHNWSGAGEPILFETMIFGGRMDQEMWRYSTYDEAVEGHNRIVAELKLEEE